MDKAMETLVQRAKNGDHQAFREIIEECWKKVFSLVLKMCQGDWHRAEDVMQEACLLAFRNLQQFHGNSSFSTWFCRIAINAQLMSGRDGWYRHVILGFDGEKIDSAVKGGSEKELRRGVEDYKHASDAGVFLMLKEYLERVSQAMEIMPPTHRTIILCRRVRGLTILECSVALGISPGLVKSRLHRAMESLRKKCREEGLESIVQAVL